MLRDKKDELFDNIVTSMAQMVCSDDIDVVFNEYNKISLWLRELYNIKEKECE